MLDPKDEWCMIVNCRRAIMYLPGVDILLYFAYAHGLVKRKHIMNNLAVDDYLQIINNIDLSIDMTGFNDNLTDSENSNPVHQRFLLDRKKLEYMSREYKTYKNKMDSIYGHSQYIHDFVSYYPRILQTYDGRIIKHMQPSLTGSIEGIQWFVKYKLEMGPKWQKKVALLFRMALCTPEQLSGLFEAHYRIFARHL